MRSIVTIRNAMMLTKTAINGDQTTANLKENASQGSTPMKMVLLKSSCPPILPSLVR